MDNDDISIGHLYSRREAVRLLAAAGGPMPGSCSPRGAGYTTTFNVAMQGV